MHPTTQNAPVIQLGCICIKIRDLFQIRTVILIQCVKTAVLFFLHRLNFKVLVFKPFLTSSTRIQITAPRQIDFFRGISVFASTFESDIIKVIV